MTSSRLPDETCEPTSAWPAVRDVMVNRRSCRAFAKNAVPREKIVELLDAAQRAASWCNTQPWEVIVTEGEATDRFRDGLYRHAEERGRDYTFDIAMPSAYTGVHLRRRREAGRQLYEALGIERGDHVGSARQALENYALFGAPHVAVITVPRELGPYAVLDTGLFVSNFLLAAESLGIGAVPQAALASFSGYIRDYFEIYDDRLVLLGISFGWPDRNHPANSYMTDRGSVDEFVTWVS